MKIKQTFKVTELEKAMNEILKAKLVAGWRGCLKLETNGKIIVLTQYPSSSSWQQGYDTIYEIQDEKSWTDFVQGLQWQDDKLVDACGNVGTRKQMFNNIDILHDCIPEALAEAQERLENVISEMEMKE